MEIKEREILSKQRELTSNLAITQESLSLSKSSGSWAMTKAETCKLENKEAPSNPKRVTLSWEIQDLRTTSTQQHMEQTQMPINISDLGKCQASRIRTLAVVSSMELQSPKSSFLKTLLPTDP